MAQQIEGRLKVVRAKAPEMNVLVQTLCRSTEAARKLVAQAHVAEFILQPRVVGELRRHFATIDEISARLADAIARQRTSAH